MASNIFNVGVPSIPGKPIRLRIQDAPKRGFQVKQPRFLSDRSKLTDELIETFDNLHPAKEAPTQSPQSTQASRHSYNSEYSQVRYVVPEYKNALVDLLRRQQEQGNKPGLQRRARRALSTKDASSEWVGEFRRKEEDRLIRLQNYYFIQREIDKIQRHRPPKPSAVFLNESRERVKERHALYDETPGPGYYSDQQAHSFKPPAPVQPPAQKQPEASDPTSLKKLTKNVFSKYHIEVQQQTRPPQPPHPSKKPHNDYMFAQDDRDRFGEQIFPIVLKTNVPGPGAYNYAETIEDKAKKVAVLEEQRRLLKDWFNQ